MAVLAWQYVGHDEGTEETKIESSVVRNYFTVCLSVCHYSIVTLPVDGPQPPDLESADFPGLVVLNLSKIHLFYQKFSKSVSQLLVPRLQMNHTSTFNYQGFPVEEENSD